MIFQMALILCKLQSIALVRLLNLLDTSLTIRSVQRYEAVLCRHRPTVDLASREKQANALWHSVAISVPQTNNLKSSAAFQN